ncbi:MAG: hypothetical protein P8R42_15600 [Candidatus Binatia bacterium]|nr:hypothetical protein [Candidatus Binatia bacterium]
MKRSLLFLGMFALLLAPAPLRAASECATELSALCAAESATPEEFVACARAKDGLLSEACQAQLAQGRRPFEERRARRRAELRDACEAEVERLCVGVKRRPKPLAHCLDANRDEVSARCLGAAGRFIARHTS